jgi:protoporphyrin/coproporphyrin ferrochelatase
MSKKTAVVLLALGGPLAEADIVPYLFNFFMDKNIIGAPWPVRRVLASFISRTRGKGAAHEAYGRLGFRSPLLDNTKKQAEALQQELGENYKTFVAMRYWHPFAYETACEVKAYAPDDIVLLPLYPQFSTATVKSALEDWRKVLPLPARGPCCWFTDEGYVTASADRIRAEIEKAPGPYRLLFSAHGLPEKTVNAGDPYQWQCEQSAEAIVKALGIPNLDWRICYQSRVGPLKWIGPSVQQALDDAAADGKGVIVYPHAFVSEHVETLVELDIEYREKSKAPFFLRAQTCGTHLAFIAGLAKLVRDTANPQRRCPNSCCCCPS